MKKHYALFSLLILPFYSIAQPVITMAENYTIGTTVKRVYCDPVAAGPAGANQTWNFGGLSPTGDTLVQWVEAAPLGSPFPGADFVLHDNDSTYTYFDTSLTEINLMGYVDSSTMGGGVFSYSNQLLTMIRPITYGDTASDSFYNSGNFGGFPINGAGFVTMEADAYGTLQLPEDTFVNVLRVKTLSTEHDSVTGFGSLDVVIHSYIWYNDTSASPLLRIDSLDFSGIFTSSEVDVQYLYSIQPTAVKSVPRVEKIKATAHLADRKLSLAGSFENGKPYQVSVYNVNGQKVFSEDFIANGQRAEFDINADISNGTYIVSIRRKGDISSLTAFKVVKQ